MNFKIGDTVSFLNEKGGGTISKIINKTTVGVTVEDGFVIPYPIEELVLSGIENRIDAGVHDQKKIEISHVNRAETVIETKNKNYKAGIYVGFSPVQINDLAHSDINVWFINYTDYKLLFTYSLYKNGSYTTLETGNLTAHSVELIETIHRSDLMDFSTFKLDVLFYNNDVHNYCAPVSELIKLKPIKLYKENAFNENDFLDEKAMIINVYLTDDKTKEISSSSPFVMDLKKAFSQKKEAIADSKKSKPHVVNDPNYEAEIDLHIEELIDNYFGMSNAEIIKIQLHHFQNALDMAISSHYRKLFVIHGVGNGRLKQEVLSILKGYTNLRYHDASYAKYGFGATEIIFY